MGAKAPEKLKLRRQPCNCDICGRTFVNTQALTSHRKFMHKNKPVPKEKESRPFKAVAKKESRHVKSVSSSPVRKEVIKPPAKVMNKVVIPETKKSPTPKKVQFKCPKCVNVFGAYFTAYRHIQKHHPVDEEGVPVPPNSPQLIKPVRCQLCVFCNKWFTSGEQHSCDGLLGHISEIYMCLGCQQTFDNLVLFEHHVKGLHANEKEYFFFPTKDEYTTWKTELEDTVKIKYVMLTNKQNSKVTFHCSHQPALETEKTLLCPSSVCVTEFKSGYQVIYYREHFGHTCTEMPSTKYKKYSISPFMKDSDGITVEKDDNVYQQFKNVMSSISVSAAKVDISVLNTLLGKALEMTVILNNTVQEEASPVNKSMTDEQISDVLAEVKTYPGKRKADSTKKEAKRPKPVLENDENSKLNNSLPSKTPKASKKSADSLPSTPLARPLLQSPTFNDTYKDFVDQNFTSKLNETKLKDNNTNTPKKSTVKKKVVMKTKIGQFKIKPSFSPKASKKSPIQTIEYRIKPDVEYEVKEQENDCNILILKI